MENNPKKDDQKQQFNKDKKLTPAIFSLRFSSAILEEFADIATTIKNSKDRVMVAGLVPLTVIAGSSKGNQGSFSWFQLEGNFKSGYNSTDSASGEVLMNESLRLFKIKFPPETIEGVNGSEFKQFFEENYEEHGNKFFVPIVSELPQTDKFGNAMKNATQLVVHPSFQLKKFIEEFKVAFK